MIKNLRIKINGKYIKEFKFPSSSIGIFYKLHWFNNSVSFVNGLGFKVFPVVLKGQSVIMSYDYKNIPYSGSIQI
jgi:hypothetical protein